MIAKDVWWVFIFTYLHLSSTDSDFIFENLLEGSAKKNKYVNQNESEE